MTLSHKGVTVRYVYNLCAWCWLPACSALYLRLSSWAVLAILLVMWDEMKAGMRQEVVEVVVELLLLRAHIRVHNLFLIITRDSECL